VTLPCFEADDLGMTTQQRVTTTCDTSGADRPDSPTPVRMMVHDLLGKPSHYYQPHRHGAELLYDYMAGRSLDTACSVGEYVLSHPLDMVMRVGASDRWTVKPEGDVADHIYYITPKETPHQALAVSLVLRPGMSKSQVKGYLDWMAELANKDLGCPWGRNKDGFGAPHRRGVESHQPCCQGQSKFCRIGAGIFSTSARF
jgi:hypothetical protein